MPDAIRERKRLLLLQQHRGRKLPQSFLSNITGRATCWIIIWNIILQSLRQKKKEFSCEILDIAVIWDPLRYIKSVIYYEVHFHILTNCILSQFIYIYIFFFFFHLKNVRFLKVQLFCGVNLLSPQPGMSTFQVLASCVDSLSGCISICSDMLITESLESRTDRC